MTNLMRKYLETLCQTRISGIWAEFGVFRGDTFKQLISLSTKNDIHLIGVDSFQGMNTPVEQDKDINGKQQYPRGKLNSKGYEKLVSDLTRLGYVEHGDYDLFKGFTPQVFQQIDSLWLFLEMVSERFSFVYLDFDHYQPTVDALNYVFPRLSVNGLILFDDFIESRNNLATLAIKEFLAKYEGRYKIEEKDIRLIDGGCKTQLLVRKI